MARWHLARGVATSVVIVAWVAPVGAGAATIPVTTDLDQSTNNTQCDLREAITSANNNSNAHEDACVAGQAAPAVDTVDLNATGYEMFPFPGSEDGNVLGDFDINPAGGAVVIDGETQDGSVATNVDADGTDRIFHVLGDAGTNPVTIRDLALESGEVTNAAGGTILMGDADLTLDNTVVAFGTIDGTDPLTMRGAGIAAMGQGELTIRDSTVRENSIDATGALAGTARGGGVFIASTTAATIDRSKIQENTIAGDGTGTGDSQILLGAGIANGAVATGQDLTITNSVIAFNNLVQGDVQEGGGIEWTESGNGNLLRLTNVTFSDNDVGTRFGGGLFTTGDAILSHTTFGPNTANFGAGLYVNGGSVQVRNSLFETGTPSDADCGGSNPVSLGYNIERGPSEECDFSEPTDQLPNFATMFALAENGGPTRTHQVAFAFLNLIPQASCLGADGTPLTRDQRNALRPGLSGSGTMCDPGAYELNQCAAGTVVKIVGSEGDDVLTGTSDADGIMGMGGNDTIAGGDGVDGICAGDGNDVLAGGEQDGETDFFRGDAGSDTLDFGTFSDVLTLDLAITAGQMAGSGIGSIEQNTIENAIGGVHVDTLLGDAGPNRLDGNFGNDPMIVGNGGSDTLLGNTGNDGLFARDGVADVVDCGPGTGDTAQTDRLSLDLVVNCESVDALPEPPVATPSTSTTVPPQVVPRKKCKKGQKLRKGKCVKKKRRKKK